MKPFIFFLAAVVFFTGATGFVLIRKLKGVDIAKPLAGESINIKLIQELTKNGIDLNMALYEDLDFLSASISGITVYFSKEDDITMQAQALQIILGKITMEGRKPMEIDLRFGKPVLRY